MANNLLPENPFIADCVLVKRAVDYWRCSRCGWRYYGKERVHNTCSAFTPAAQEVKRVNEEAAEKLNIRPEHIIHYSKELWRLKEDPGIQLKKLLGRFGIKDKAGCKCNKRAREMDARGCDWCEQNIELIVDWMQEEAERRKLPFVRLAGKTLVKLAIRKARKREVA